MNLNTIILAFVGKANKEICWVTCPPETECNEERGLLQQFTLQRSSTGPSIVIEIK